MPTRRRISTGEALRVDIDLVDQHCAGDPRDRVGFVHAVQAADEGGFAAAGGADQGGGVIRRDMQLMSCKVWLVPYHAFRSLTSMPTPKLTCSLQYTAAGKDSGPAQLTP